MNEILCLNFPPPLFSKHCGVKMLSSPVLKLAARILRYQYVCRLQLIEHSLLLPDATSSEATIKSMTQYIPRLQLPIWSGTTRFLLTFRELLKKEGGVAFIDLA
jgi:hypothetical protein